MRTIYSHTALRGIAAFSVMMIHLGHQKKVTIGLNESYFRLFDWGSYAVDLFFILSGFIMNWVYCSGREEAFSWGKYYVARIARIIPLYLVTLIPFLPFFIYVFYNYGYLHDNGKYLKVFLGNIFLLSGFFNFSSNYWILNNPSWSISIELLAYFAVFPILKVLRYSIGLRLNVVIITVSVLILCFCYILADCKFYIFDITRIMRGIVGFTTGYLLCSLWCNKYKMNSVAIDAVIIAVFIVFGACIAGLVSKVFLVFLMPALVFFTAYDKGWICNFMKLNILQWLGQRSYSIYLWHWPIIYIIFVHNSKQCFNWWLDPKTQGISNVIIAVGIICIVSEISYSFFEEPIRKFARRRISI